MVIIGIFHVRIGSTIMRHHKFIRANTCSFIGMKSTTSGEQESRKTEYLRVDEPGTSRSSIGHGLRTKQVTLMLFIITVVFVLSFIPHLVLMVTISIKSDFLKEMSPAGVAMYNIFLRSFVINNMANPVIYGFCDTKFRCECATVASNVRRFGRRK